MKSPAFSRIEALEARIAPASMLTYTDVDGDIVRISASKGMLAAGDLAFVGGGTSGVLKTLTLNGAFEEADITIAVTKIASNGDGAANVGYINAAGVDLGTVTVKGNLDEITAGSGAAANAIKALDVHSMGVLRFRNGAPETLGVGFKSAITGTLGALNVTGDVDSVFISVTDNLNAINIG